MKLLTVKDIMETHGVSKKVALNWAKAAGTVPRGKNCKVYVSEERLNRFLEHGNA